MNHKFLVMEIYVDFAAEIGKRVSKCTKQRNRLLLCSQQKWHNQSTWGHSAKQPWSLCTREWVGFHKRGGLHNPNPVSMRVQGDVHGPRIQGGRPIAADGHVQICPPPLVIGRGGGGGGGTMMGAATKETSCPKHSYSRLATYRNGQQAS